MFKSKNRRSISTIVAQFTKVRTELQIAVETEEKEIVSSKSRVDIANAVNRTEILEAENKLSELKKKSNSKLGKVLSAELEIGKQAHDSINEANLWLEQIPTIANQ